MSISNGKKSDYYTSPDNYSDLGQMKTFTNIDHDVKTSISPHVSEKIDYVAFFKEYRKDLVKRITSIPASVCPWPFMDFTNREMNRLLLRGIQKC